jgi:hypothetical protein
MSDLDLAVELAINSDLEFSEQGPQEELNSLRFDLRAAKISIETYKAISLQAKNILDDVRSECMSLKAENQSLVTAYKTMMYERDIALSDIAVMRKKLDVQNK